MVRAILDGRKTQTRRVVNRVAGIGSVTEFMASDTPGYDFIMRDRRLLWNDLRKDDLLGRCPFGAVGKRLWIRETFSTSMGALVYKADTGGDELVLIGAGKKYHWTPSIHMPRWASRITLEITGVRVDRLQEISDKDVEAEGMGCLTKDGKLYKYGFPDSDGLPGNDDYGWHWQEWETSPQVAYQKLWSATYGPASWGDNPWVWVIEFRRVS